ncbi:Rrf2 family transcriptional regulator [Burkholderia anthina]|uniref:Rrf2 family transcriptional regulator n=1 Tax=Burkholderia anthina TaxID=179879 RepID=UPI00158D63E1|nr:Rrf2 family transcriptional regulator [Burkholderia anthina]
MRLTVHADYALRLLVYLGTSSDELCKIKDIADSYGISKHHLVKVAQALAAEGFIETVRGSGGGIRLLRKVEKITIGEVVRAAEPDFFLVECLDRTNPLCRIDSACILKGALREALDNFLATLDNYTLSDVLSKKPKLGRLLGIPLVAA